MTTESRTDHNRSQKNVTYHRKINVTSASKINERQSILHQSAQGHGGKACFSTCFLSMSCRKILILFNGTKRNICRSDDSMKQAKRKSDEIHANMLTIHGHSKVAEQVMVAPYSTRLLLFAIPKSYKVHKSTINFNTSRKALNF